MSTWTLPAPTPSALGDHDVTRDGAHLAGRRVALLITGGIAAMKLPLVARALRREGAEVVAFVSKEALRYVTAETLEWSTVHPIVQRLTAAAEHLSDSAPFDAYLLAPATYNSINKIAAGIADGVVTSTAASALGRLEQGRTAVLCAPTMHGSLHNRILVASLRRLHELGVRIIPPRDAYGKHNLPDEQTLVAEVARAVSRSPLRGRRLLVTGGTTALPIDGVQQLVHRFHPGLGIAVAMELHLRGADVTLIQGDSVLPVPALLPHRVAPTFSDYRHILNEELMRGYAAAVFAAGVAEYQPEQVVKKLPGGQAHLMLPLLPTAKINDEVQAAHPSLYLIPFHYEADISPAQLTDAARARGERFSCVVASREPESASTPSGPRPWAWIVSTDGEPRPVNSPHQIAESVADHLEKVLAIG